MMLLLGINFLLFIYVNNVSGETIDRPFEDEVKEGLRVTYKVINDDEEFDLINKTVKFGMVVAYKVAKDENEDALKNALEFLKNVHTNFIYYNYHNFGLFSVDCSKSPIEKFCSSEDNFILITLFSSDFSTQQKFDTKFDKETENYLLTAMFTTVSNTRPHFHFMNTVSEMKIPLSADASQKWFLCYGRNFCYKIGSMYRENEEIYFAHVNTKHGLMNVNEYLNLGISTSDMGYMFGLWYINCTSTTKDQTPSCASRRYLGDENVYNVHLFMKLLFVPNFAQMKKEGSHNLFGGIPGPTLFCFHNNDTKVETVERAKEMADQLWGYAFVVAVNVDVVKKGFLRGQMDINLKEHDKWPFYKLWPRTGVDNKLKMANSIKVEGEPVEFVFRFYKTVYDLDSLSERHGDESEILQFSQDDEVELLLAKLKEDRCPTCPIDMKNVQMLSKNNVDTFTTSDIFRMIIFWNKVDPLSRAMLHIMADASTLVSREDPVFGSLGCHDWPDICAKHKVHTFPTVLMFKDGATVGAYRGILDSEVIADTAILRSLPDVLHLATEEEVENFCSGNYLQLSNGKLLQTFTLGIFQSSMDPDLEAYKISAGRLSGRYLLAWTVADIAKQWFEIHLKDKPIPKLITFTLSDNYVDDYQIFPVQKSGLEEDAIVKFVEVASRPKFIQLNLKSYPIIRRNVESILIFLSNDPKASHLYENLPDFSEDFQVAILNRMEEADFSAALLNRWNLSNIKDDLIVFVNFHKGTVHSIRTSEMPNHLMLTSWLAMAENEKLEPHVKLENVDWSRRPLMFDHLHMIYGTASKDVDQLQETVKIEENQKKKMLMQHAHVNGAEDGEGSKCPFKHMFDGAELKDDGHLWKDEL